MLTWFVLVVIVAALISNTSRVYADDKQQNNPNQYKDQSLPVRVLHFPENQRVGTLSVHHLYIPSENPGNTTSEEYTSAPIEDAIKQLSEIPIKTISGKVVTDMINECYAESECDAQGIIEIAAGFLVTLSIDQRVRTLDFISSLDPAGIQKLWINSAIPPDQFKQLNHLTGLTELIVCLCELDDNGQMKDTFEDDLFQQIKDLANLTTVFIRSFNLSDQGLAYLKSFPKLKKLFIELDCFISRAGIQKLSEQLPDIEITLPIYGQGLQVVRSSRYITNQIGYPPTIQNLSIYLKEIGHSTCAVNGLALMGKSAIPALVEYILTGGPIPLRPSPDKEDYRRYAFTALARMGYDGLPALYELLKNPDPGIRKKVVCVINELLLPIHERVPFLLSLLQDVNDLVRLNALRILARIITQKNFVRYSHLRQNTIDALLVVLDGENAILGTDAAAMLHQLEIESPKIIQALIRYLQSPDPKGRNRAISILGCIYKGHKEYSSLLVPLLDDPDPDNVIHAFNTMSILGEIPLEALAAAPRVKELNPMMIDFHE